DGAEQDGPRRAETTRADGYDRRAMRARGAGHRPPGPVFRFDRVTDRVEPGGPRGGDPLLRRRRRLLRERLVEARDGLADVVDRRGGERVRGEAPVEPGLPGVDDHRGVPAEE